MIPKSHILAKRITKNANFELIVKGSNLLYSTIFMSKHKWCQLKSSRESIIMGRKIKKDFFFLLWLSFFLFLQLAEQSMAENDLKAEPETFQLPTARWLFKANVHCKDLNLTQNKQSQCYEE